MVPFTWLLTMSKLIIGFSKAKSPFKIGSTVIQQVDKKKYSHCYILYTDGITKVELVAQASHGFVNLVSKDIFLEQNIIIKEYAIECTEAQHVGILTFIHNNLGKPYSKLQLILIGIKKLFHIELNIHDKDASFICSEFAARVCSIAGIKVPEDLDYFGPSDLEVIVQDIGVLL